MALLLSTAYAAPIGYMALLYKEQGGYVYLEGSEHIVKQSWRNRCDVATSQGVQSLSIPIERPQGNKTLIKDVRICQNKAWQHQHTQALKTNYGCSPYFEYYWDDLQSVYESKYRFLWDLNWDLLMRFIQLLGLDVEVRETTTFVPLQDNPYDDYRYHFHPRLLRREILKEQIPYYQPFAGQQGFIPELSIYDLLMNMGPESLLYLQGYTHKDHIRGYGR